MGFWFIYFALIVLIIVAQWMLVEKAGYPGISQIIPIWNMVVLVKMAGYSGIAVLWYFVPLANVVFAVLVSVRVCKAFDKDGGFILLYIFLPIIAIPVLAFGDADYNEARIA